MQIRDGKNRIRDPGWKKLGSCIRENYFGSATLKKNSCLLSQTAVATGRRVSWRARKRRRSWACSATSGFRTLSTITWTSRSWCRTASSPTPGWPASTTRAGWPFSGTLSTYREYLRPVLRIQDVYPVSDFFPSRIPDPNCLHPGSRICIKEFKYFNLKKRVSEL